MLCFLGLIWCGRWGGVVPFGLPALCAGSWGAGARAFCWAADPPGGRGVVGGEEGCALEWDVEADGDQCQVGGGRGWGGWEGLIALDSHSPLLLFSMFS